MLQTVGEKIAQNKEKLDAFFRQESQGLTPPFYLSCDVRHSGKKLGIIDTNLFPSGFNNLCEAYSRRAALAIRNYLNRYHPGTEKIILLAEEHTRNRFYLENIDRLRALILSVGVNVRVAFAGAEIRADRLEVPLGDDRRLHLHRLEVIQGKPAAGDWTADLIISNNDFSQGIPSHLVPVLDRIVPSPHLGWHRRRKSTHFSILKGLIARMAEILQVDPWLLMGLFRSVKVKNLSSPEELQVLSQNVRDLLAEIEKKYREYGIQDPPYAFIKNEAGTYGMGLWDVSDPEEVLRMNRRTRNKLLSAKGGVLPEAFLLQEGIPTADFYSSLPIEPVIYMIGFEPIGGFFRMNAQRDALSSLNTRGMVFSCLCLHKLDEPHEENFLNCAEKEHLVQMSTVMAKVATLAAAKEIARLKD